MITFSDLNYIFSVDLPKEGSITGISIDTRTIESGNLFLALRGDTYDGHDFIPHALAKGASVIVSAQERPDISMKGLHICYDPLQFLHRLARHMRKHTHARICAITGSVGKTTTKAMLAHVLSSFGTTVSPVASFNNHIGVPLTLAKLVPDTMFGVVEIGMNHRGEIAPLAEMTSPQAALITTIAEAHIGHLGSLDEIAREKGDVFKGLSSQGWAIIPDQVPCAKILYAAAKERTESIIRVGRNVRILNCVPHEDHPETKVVADVFGECVTYSLPFWGDHYVHNSLFVLALSAVWRLDLKQVADVLSSFHLVEGRGSTMRLFLPQKGRKNGGSLSIVDDAYNANPASMRAGLSMLSRFKGRKIAILGDMLELGEHAETYHRDLRDALIKADVEKVYASGPLMRVLYESLSSEMQGYWSENPDDLVAPLLSELNAEDVLFVKGSKGSRIRSVIKSLKTSLV